MSEPVRITSRQNSRVKEALQLRVGRERLRQGRFLIDGVREVSRAIAAGVRCSEAFVCEELCTNAAASAAVDALEKAGCEVLHISPEVYTKLAFGDRKDGIVAVAVTPRPALADLELPPVPLVAVVEGIEKPGNLGAILRSADAAGVDALIVADGRTDLYNPNTIRASLGTVFRENVCEATTDHTLGWLRQKGLTIVTARPDAEQCYTDTDFCRGVAVVLGSEAAGLTTAWRGTGVTAVRLPMRGIADSLNVSTTAAILFYEALRQRSAKKDAVSTAGMSPTS